MSQLELQNAPVNLLPQYDKQIRAQKQYDYTKDKLVSKYGNKGFAESSDRKVRSGLAAYTGPWTKTEARHLIKRTMFGVKAADVDALSNLTMAQAVDALLNTTPNAMPLPVNYYENFAPDTTGVAYGQTWINADYGDGTIDYWRTIGLKGNWLQMMVDQNLSIFEQMVMFWYNLVPVQSTAEYAKFNYNYLMLIRSFAMGNFKQFINAATKQDAMLLYLNGFLNNKYSPDENYARELQELFTVGKDGGQQFSENDVQEAARVLTGWRINFTNLTSFYDDTLHDDTNKQFSSFYNNAVVAGQSGPNGGDLELNALLNIIFSGNSALETAKHICRKLYLHFVYYNIDASVETNIITPLAQTFVNSNWEIKPVLEQLLKSEHFFDVANQGCMIKTPLQIIAGLPRTFEFQADSAWNFEQVNIQWLRQVYYAQGIGQEVYEVPNVSGWKPYYQMPMYHQLWINSDTFPKRLRYTDSAFTNYGFYVDGVVSYKIDPVNFALTLDTPEDPDALIQQVCDLCYGLDVSTNIKNELKANLLNNQLTNSYWTNAWNNYLGNPSDTQLYNTVRNRLRNLLQDVCHRAEFHLC
ncbi:MAG: hypothetical protein RL660_108 [Bacteroidota bacterium]|jgi:hypothetical protein